MTVSHAAEDRILGGERQSGGLWVHKGKLSVGPTGGGAPGSVFDCPRAPGDINANRGGGTGVYYFGGNSGAYLYYDGTQFVLNGGRLNPVNGLTPGTVQPQIGSYTQAISWSLPQSSLWTETPIQCTVTFSGVLTRFEFNVLLGCPIKGARTFWSIMFNGSLATSGVSLGAADAPDNSYAFMAEGVYYATPAAGTYRVGFAVYGQSGVIISNQIWSTLYVTEQKA